MSCLAAPPLGASVIATLHLCASLGRLTSVAWGRSLVHDAAQVLWPCTMRRACPSVWRAWGTCWRSSAASHAGTALARMPPSRSCWERQAACSPPRRRVPDSPPLSLLIAMLSPECQDVHPVDRKCKMACLDSMPIHPMAPSVWAVASSTVAYYWLQAIWCEAHNSYGVRGRNPIAGGESAATMGHAEDG